MEISINGARVLAQIENVPIFGTVQITQTLAVSWLVVIIIAGLSLWLGSGLKVAGISRKQAVSEMAYNALVNFVRGNMGSEFDHYIPLVGAIFISSLVSNLIGILGIWSPTADLMTELAWALVVFVLAPINVMAECFTPVSMACRHFGNILSGTVISTLIYGALTFATNALFGALGSSLIVAGIVTVLGIAALLLGKKLAKKLWFVLGIIITILGVLAVITNLGATFPWLTVGIPAVFSLYFDWFGGCIQAFIFCTLTTLFIKQAAGD